MTEVEAINIIDTEVKKTAVAFKIDVISRDFANYCTSYVATIVVILKDDTLMPQTLKDITDRLINDGITDIRLVGTKKDLKELDYEVLILEAEITIGE